VISDESPPFPEPLLLLSSAAANSRNVRFLFFFYLETFRNGDDGIRTEHWSSRRFRRRGVFVVRALRLRSADGLTIFGFLRQRDERNRTIKRENNESDEGERNRDR